MAEMVTGPTDHAQVSGTVGRSQGPGIEWRHSVVVTSVHQQEVPWPEPTHTYFRGDRPKRTRPTVKVSGKLRI